MTTDAMNLIDRMSDTDALILRLESERVVRPDDEILEANLESVRDRRQRLEDDWNAYLRSHAAPLADGLQQLRRQTQDLVKQEDARIAKRQKA